MKKYSSHNNLLSYIILIALTLCLTVTSVNAEDFMTNKIGNTGIRTGVVALKILPFEKNSSEAFNKALACGVNFIDVSPYEKDAELFIARNLGPSRRQNVVLATRWQVSQGLGEEDYITLFNKSIKNMNTSKIDMVVIDNVYETRQLDGNAFLNAFRKLRKDGKTRYLGINIKNTKGYARQILNKILIAGDYDFIITDFSTFNHSSARSFVEFAGRKGLGVIVEGTIEEGKINPDKARRIAGRSKMPLETALINWAVNTSKWVTAILVPPEDPKTMELYLKGAVEEDW